MKTKTLKLMITTLIIFSLTQSTLNAGNFSYSAPKKYPDGELGRIVKLGEDIMNNSDTHPLTKDLVGNSLKCKTCHLQGEDGKTGTQLSLGTFIGTATAFPAYSKREKTVQTLQDRINNCFMRSMNGKRPIIDTEASMAMATYITWLSDGMPMQMNGERPCSPLNNDALVTDMKKFAKIQKKATHLNYLNGKKLFNEKCAYCHGQNGEGNGGGVGMFPPLWGKDKKGRWLAYNAGAGLTKLHEGAAWVQSNMPLGQGNTLKDQVAADIMLYVNAQSRDKFDLTKGLLPKKEMGYYNSKVFQEKHSVKSRFKDFGLDINIIRGDKKMN